MSFGHLAPAIGAFAAIEDGALKIARKIAAIARSESGLFIRPPA